MAVDQIIELHVIHPGKRDLRVGSWLTEGPAHPRHPMFKAMLSKVVKMRFAAARPTIDLLFGAACHLGLEGIVSKK